jgi:hypothetical protein
MTQDFLETQETGITPAELVEIALYTVQKINSYPQAFGKTVENYFHLLFPDEMKAFMMRKAVNTKTFGTLGIELSSNNGRGDLSRALQAQQISEIKTLCNLLSEQQIGLLRIISDKIDALEANLSVSDAGGEAESNAEKSG